MAEQREKIITGVLQLEAPIADERQYRQHKANPGFIIRSQQTDIFESGDILNNGDSDGTGIFEDRLYGVAGSCQGISERNGNDSGNDGRARRG